jgi:hypothetical protein
VTVRKTESRIPAGVQPADLGEAVLAGDGRSTVVSFVSSPLVIGRENTYIVFVTDAALAGSTQSYEWTFTENRVPVSRTSVHGEMSYAPLAAGGLVVLVKLLGAGGSELAQLTISQDVVAPNPTLEGLITGAKNEPGPRVANPDVARELVNDHNPYYQNVSLQTAEPGDGFQRFVFGIVLDGALQRSAAARKQHLDELAAALNGQSGDFVALTARGAGVSGLRLTLLAMTLPKAPGSPATFLDFTELPEPPARRALADEDLRRSLGELDEAARIDLFNLVRCPKSNITSCGRVIEALRDRYFAGTSFEDVLTGMSGTRAHWITRHLREGPLLRT